MIAASVVALSPPSWSQQASADPLAGVVARALAEAVMAQDAEAAAVLCAAPVSFDGEMARSDAEVLSHWERALSRRELRGLRLERVSVMPLSTALERFGPPPQRLGELPEGSFVALLRMDRSQLIAILAEVDGRWAVVAVTD